VLWGAVGYSLAFGEGSAFIGDLRYAFLQGVGAAPNADYAGTIPAADLYDLPAHVRHHHPGADHRRFRRANEVQRDAAIHDAWTLVVYFPMAHMVWGKGGLLNAFLGGSIPASISPEARSCILPPASPRSFARFTLVSVPAIREQSPHSLVLSFIGASAVGGLVRF
jgi:Amt family ammonium transporter